MSADLDLVGQVRDLLGQEPSTDIAEHVHTVLHRRGTVLGRTGLDDTVREVSAQILGAGPLQPLLDSPDVTDVLVNGPDQVWVDRGHGLERMDLTLGDPREVRDLAVRLAASGGQRLDDASPMVDARLPDGTRLHAVVAPVCEQGALISLRVLRQGALSLSDLVARGGVAPTWQPVLEALVAKRANVLIAGATGTGKTTLLGALLALVPPTERIICIEEARELAPDHPHMVPLAARHANVEGAGRVELADLVRTALRMRPDRIVLGECRGPEIREMLMALNTGHEGGWATIHANTAQDVPARLDALAGLANLSPASLAMQAASAFDAVVHLRREREYRVIAEVAVVGRSASGELTVEPALSWDRRAQRTEFGPGWPQLAHRLDLPA